MNEHKDIRWHQRFSNFNKALAKLTEAIDYINKDLEKESISIDDESADNVLDDIIKGGIIQRFEYTHELAWKVMKDYLQEIGGILNLMGSKDSTREAFEVGLIENGDIWMDMIGGRNKTSHTYNEETAEEIYLNIINNYHQEFLKFQNKMEQLRSGEQSELFNN